MASSTGPVELAEQPAPTAAVSAASDATVTEMPAAVAAPEVPATTAVDASAAQPAEASPEDVEPAVVAEPTVAAVDPVADVEPLAAAGTVEPTAAAVEPTTADVDPTAAGGPPADATVAVAVAPATPPPPHIEKHKAGGDLIKSMVFGGLDAIINSESTVSAVFGAPRLAVVWGAASMPAPLSPLLASVAGGGLSSHVALTLGFANLVADGIAMALGDYLSSKAEFDLALAVR